ncbi:MAG TPA: MarR family transcriptional regulator, partial [Micromonospora sp.]
LFTLDRHGESTHRQMAERCFIRPATLTGIVDTLERDGFVERHRDATDRRAVRLALTAKGHEHLRQLSDMIHRNAPLTSVDVDPAKAAVIREFLIQLIDSISEGEDGRVNHHHGEADESGKPGGAAC